MEGSNGFARDRADPGATQRGTLRVTSRCRSPDDFVASFARFVSFTSVSLVVPRPIPVGARRRFQFELADGTVVLAGNCQVGDVPGSPQLADGRHHISLRFLELTAPSRDMLFTLLASRTMAIFAGRPYIVRGTPEPDDVATVVDMPRADREDPAGDHGAEDDADDDTDDGDDRVRHDREPPAQSADPTMPTERRRRGWIGTVGALLAVTAGVISGYMLAGTFERAAPAVFRAVMDALAPPAAPSDAPPTSPRQPSTATTPEPPAGSTAVDTTVELAATAGAGAAMPAPPERVTTADEGAPAGRGRSGHKRSRDRHRR